MHTHSLICLSARSRCFYTIANLQLAQLLADENSLVPTKSTRNEYVAADFRVLILQQIGLPILVSPALDLLAKDSLLEAEYYPGDLLHAVLVIAPEFYAQHTELLDRIIRIAQSTLEHRRNELDFELMQRLERFLHRNHHRRPSGDKSSGVSEG